MIQIYSTTFCPYCLAAKNLLKERQLEFSEINIESINMSREELERKTGGRTVPQIVIDGKVIGGYEDLLALDNQGKLPTG